MLRIAVLISGNGTNLQAVINAIKDGYLDCKIEMVISDNPDAYGIKRAQDNCIPVYVFDRKVYKKNLSDQILKTVEGRVDLIVLAGYLSIIRGEILSKFREKIINIHPSLIPEFCGKGMYGEKVHEAVILNQKEESGCTVHFVDEGTDTGPVIMQKRIRLNENETAHSLALRVHNLEYSSLLQTLKLFCDKRIKISGGKVIIKESENVEKGINKCIL